MNPKYLLVLAMFVECGMSVWMLGDFFAHGHRLSAFLAGVIGVLFMRTWRTFWQD